MPFGAQGAESCCLNHVIPSFSPLTSQPLASVLITPQLSYTHTHTHAATCKNTFAHPHSLSDESMFPRDEGFLHLKCEVLNGELE